MKNCDFAGIILPYESPGRLSFIVVVVYRFIPLFAYSTRLQVVFGEALRLFHLCLSFPLSP